DKVLAKKCGRANHCVHRLRVRLGVVQHRKRVDCPRVPHDVIRIAFLPGVDIDFVYKFAVRATGALQIAAGNLNGVVDLGESGQRSVRNATGGAYALLGAVQWRWNCADYQEKKKQFATWSNQSASAFQARPLSRLSVIRF